MASPKLLLGNKIRASRIERALTQARLAEALGISASYLNLIEHDKRPITAELLVRVAQTLDLDLQSLAVREDPGLVHDLLEIFGDPLFDRQRLTDREVREFAGQQPDAARSVRELYQAYKAASASSAALSETVQNSQESGGIDRTHLSSEQVSDLMQQHFNHFPELEDVAESVCRKMDLEGEDLFQGLTHYLEREHRVRVEVRKVGEMNGAIRSFDPERRRLALSEALRRGSRNFQLAHQVALLECPDILDRIVHDPSIGSDESRALGRIALANYFASAVLMPYEEILQAAEETRYDIDLLGHRFRVSFEQVCQRLTSLRRKGRQGIPFFFVRVDIAGNISKKFSSSGVRFPRFSGLCSLRNVHAAFLQPGRIRVQVSRLPDGTRFFSVARTVRMHRGGYQSPDILHSIALGCDIDQAARLVYADGVDLDHPEASVPVGVTCRVCDRISCAARAFPSLQRPLKIDENQRGISFYAPVE